MKSIKTYLIVVSLLLAFAIACGVYVWYTVQQTQTRIEQIGEKEPVPIEVKDDGAEAQNVSGATSTTQGDVSVSPTAGTQVAPVSEVVKPIVVDTNTLSDSQQKILESFGYSGSLTITPAMIACAEEAVGKERLQQIMDGNSPSPLESLKLLPCFKA